LKDDGIFLLHTIGLNHPKMPRSEGWMCTHIFPGGALPRPGDITRESEANNFVIEDWHNFGLDYAKTLREWRVNFKKDWSALKDKYGHGFYLTWLYYLTVCEGIFLSRKTQLWQVVLSKGGLKEGYISVR